MKRITKKMLTFSALMFLIMPACKTAKLNYPALEEFKIGQSGGFAGTSEEYFVTKDGRILLRDYTRGTDELILKLPRKTAKTLFRRFDALALSEIEMYKPFNMNYYLEMKLNGRIHRILWGDPKSPPPGDIGAFYEYCWGLIKNRN